MAVERINSQLKKVREQIAQLQAKEKDLAEQKQMAEDESQTTETENKITLDASGNAAAGDQSTENKTAEPSTLDELFGGENLSVTYTGAEIAAKQ